MFKWVGGAIGAGGVVVGGYYGVEALTNHSIPVVVRNTIEKKLKEAGYTIFRLENEEWQEKFDQLRGGDKLTTLAKILQETKGAQFVVTKEVENKDGGQALKDWYIEVLNLEVEKATANKSTENAKSFCAELKTTTKASPSPSLPEPGSAG